MTSWRGDGFRTTGPLWGASLSQNASNAKIRCVPVFLLEQAVEQAADSLVIRGVMTLMYRHSNVGVLAPLSSAMNISTGCKSNFF